jgi:uncharacterized membrane protein
MGLLLLATAMGPLGLRDRRKKASIEFIAILCGTFLIACVIPFIIHRRQVRRGKWSQK